MTNGCCQLVDIRHLQVLGRIMECIVILLQRLFFWSLSAVLTFKPATLCQQRLRPVAACQPSNAYHSGNILRCGTLEKVASPCGLFLKEKLLRINEIPDTLGHPP